MSTNKIVLRETDEIMADYKPSYQPFWPILLDNAKSYPEVVGKVNFKRLEAVGNIRAQHYNPKDTHVHQIAAVEKSKTFKKYFFASQFTQSTLQDRDQNEDVIKQVLDENNKFQDDLVLLGEGTSAADVVNNGLYWSADPNYLLESSTELAAGTDSHLASLHASVVTAKIKADTVAGRKVVVFYGSTMLTKLSGIYAASSVPFRSALQNALGGNYSLAELPAEVTPSGANGFMILTLDQIMLHYTAVPKLDDQGVDAKNREVWHNFLMGSTMIEVLAYKGIIRQPHTFGA
jgi:hypothetical protein